MPFGPTPLAPAGLGLGKGYETEATSHEPIIVGEEDHDFGFSKSFDFEQPPLRRSSTTSSDEPQELGSGGPLEIFPFGEQADSTTPALSVDETPFSANIGSSDFDGIHFEPLFQPQPHAFACAFSTAPLSAPQAAVISAAAPQQSTVTCSPKELFADPSSPPFGVEPLTLKSPPPLAPASRPEALEPIASQLFDLEPGQDLVPESDVDNDPTFAIEAASTAVKKTAKGRASTKRKRVASVTPSDDDHADKSDKFTGTRKTSVPLVDLDAPIAPRYAIVLSKSVLNIALMFFLYRSHYTAPSRTSRKDVPVLMQRHFKKQKRDISADATEGELEPDAKAEIESKRKANTIAARRSRQRKAEHLKSLETSLEQARAEVSDFGIVFDAKHGLTWCDRLLRSESFVCAQSSVLSKWKTVFKSLSVCSVLAKLQCSSFKSIYKKILTQKQQSKRPPAVSNRLRASVATGSQFRQQFCRTAIFVWTLFLSISKMDWSFKWPRHHWPNLVRQWSFFQITFSRVNSHVLGCTFLACNNRNKQLC